MYEIIRLIVKKVLIPLLELFVRFSPKSLRVFLFASIADSLKLVNVRFDAPMALPFDHGRPQPHLNLGLFSGDRSVVPSILISGQWELSEPEFVAARVERDKSYTLFDVGANFGLFSLQLIELLRGAGDNLPIQEIHLFEPDPNIAPILRQNMIQAGQRGVGINVVQKALGRTPGKATFYLDNSNKANNSLAKGAMNRAVGGVTQIEVEVMGAADIVDMLPSDPNGRVIYKSDLQGIDPDIVASIPKPFWDRVDILIIELWPQVLKDYDFNTEAFKEVISQFATVLIEDRGATRPVTADELGLIISAAQDHRYFNLLCCRFPKAR